MPKPKPRKPRRGFWAERHTDDADWVGLFALCNESKATYVSSQEARRMGIVLRRGETKFYDVREMPEKKKVKPRRIGWRRRDYCKGTGALPVYAARE